MDGRGGAGEVEDIVYNFWVSGMNENGRKLIELCTERKLSMGNKLFYKKDNH